jgi:predicted thioesterase
MFLYTTMTNSSATVTTEDGGRQNMFASEPRIEVMEIVALEFYRQYLHNPAVHTFFQSQGIFLF